MLTSFRVRNFRCFKDLTVKPLERVNLIAGKNNVGKSALLEALWLFQQYDRPGEAILVTRRRGLFRLSPKEYLESIVQGFDLGSTIEIDAMESHGLDHVFSITVREKDEVVIFKETDSSASVAKGTAPAGSIEEAGAEYEIRNIYQPPGREPRTYVSTVDPDGTITQTRSGHFELRPGSFLLARQMDDPGWIAEKLSELTERREKKLLLDALCIIEQRLEDVNILQKGRHPVVYADLNGYQRLMPLALLGEGMSRLLSMVLGVASARRGILLVDEMENGLHYSVMTKVWKVIAAAARTFDVQVFATTHSDECIRAAYNAFADDEAFDFRFHRLDNIDGNISSVTYDKETLEFALEHGWEVR